MKRSHIRAIEKIQMWANEMIDRMSYVDYDEMLKVFSRTILSYRRARG